MSADRYPVWLSSAVVAWLVAVVCAAVGWSMRDEMVRDRREVRDV